MPSEKINSGPIKDFFRGIYEKLIKINDSPQKIALGLGLGVFLGIFPGVGPLAALALAFVLRVNQAAAFAGSLLTNTWFSLVTLVLAIKIGAALTGTNWSDIYETARQLITHFHWQNLFDASVKSILKPLLLGFAVVGLFFGLLAYGAALIILLKRKKRLP